ncbi:hypothetical protein NQ314_021007 [Rhamnusium bicolor]|uniref:Transposase n=1 Tax=Rhamnusium bicolor TaxID=1586634 RepID=A0AAV8WK73_9CUCU|nr:hypothetical protein NQ314_021007 [Rhamnusium bicolor]
METNNMGNNIQKMKRRKPLSAMQRKYLKSLLRKNIRNKHAVIHTGAQIGSIKPSTTIFVDAAATEMEPAQTSLPSSIPSSTIFFQKPAENMPQASIIMSDKKTLRDELASWAVLGNISHSNLNKLLEILRQDRNIFEFKNLPADCRTLLKTEKRNYIIATERGLYYHFGLVNMISQLLISKNIKLNSDVLEVDVNVDGLPLTKSSNSQFWPILGSLANVDSCKNPFVIGVYHGFNKPEHPYEPLNELVNEYLAIKDCGFFYQSRKIKLKFSKLICDAPAKSFVLGVKGHNSYFGCTKYVCEGTYINNRMCCPNLNSALRTDEQFRSNAYDDYHKYETPLLYLDIDLVEQIPLDYMHLICIGVMKKMLLFWVKGNISVRMNKSDLKKTDQCIQNFRKHINSNDFSRLPRSLLELERWKATELRQFLFWLLLSLNLCMERHCIFQCVQCIGLNLITTMKFLVCGQKNKTLERKAIEKCFIPQSDWLHIKEVKILGKYSLYNERQFANSSEGESIGSHSDLLLRENIVKRKIKKPQKFIDELDLPIPSIDEVTVNELESESDNEESSRTIADKSFQSSVFNKQIVTDVQNGNVYVAEDYNRIIDYPSVM